MPLATASAPPAQLGGIPVARQEKVRSSWMPWLLMAAAIFYNAGLGFLNAHGLRLSEAHVAATELFILFCAALFLGTRFSKLAPLRSFVIGSFMVVMVLVAWVSVTNGQIFLRAPRDFAIICVFFLVGTQASQERMIPVFRIIVLIVLAVLLIEGFAVSLYVWLFQPADYFANTRGIEKLSVDKTGLFRNSLGFAGRFSFGLFDNRRLSSVFLEQVSLANFAMVLCIFTVTFWQNMKTGDRALFAFAIVFMIMCNSSRTGSLLCVLMAMGYKLYPKLPRWTYGAMIPGILFVSAVLFYRPGEMSFSDTMSGRMGNTLAILAHMDIGDFITGDLVKIAHTGDSGYAYLVFGTTLVGLLYYWVFVWVLLPSGTAISRRFGFCALLFISVNLMVGAAIFSIKVSAPLWLIAGCLAARDHAARPLPQPAIARPLSPPLRRMEG